MSPLRGAPPVTVIAHINLAGGFRGGERQTELLVRGLCGRDWRQLVIGRRGEPLLERLKGIAGVEPMPVGNNPLAAARAAAGASLVHVHEGRSAKAGLVANLIYRVPYVITRRVPQLPSRSPLTRLAYRRAACIAGVSRAVGEAMGAYVPGARIACIYDALGRLPFDDQAAGALRSGWKGRIVAGHVGALVDRHKGQAVLIEAARALAGRRPEILFVLLGSGPDEDALRHLAGDLPNVVFEGFRDNVGDYLAAFDLLVFPSREEGLGSAVIDAMAFGLPVVASRVGGLPEVVAEGETGFLVPPGDAAALAAAVGRLAGDAELRQAMAAAARRRAQAFAPEAMVEAYDRLYREVLGPGSRGAAK